METLGSRTVNKGADNGSPPGERARKAKITEGRLQHTKGHKKDTEFMMLAFDTA
jgi:hypothetical protein